jgi:two-component sensor histidine kinase
MLSLRRTTAVPGYDSGGLLWLWTALAFGLVCGILFGGFTYYMARTSPPWLLTWVVYSQLGSAILYVALAIIVRWSDRLPQGWSWAIVFAAAIACACLSSFNVYQSMVWFQRGNPEFRADYVSGMGISLLIDVWLFGFFAVAQKLLHRMEIERRREANLADAKFAAGQAQLRALRSQINPHFLFNTLNSISSLITSGRGVEAKAMMDQLAEYFRSTARSETTTFTTLAEELSGIEAYLAIERVRFGDRLAFEIDCPPDLHDALVPPLILQPLIENAVKHGVAPSGDRVTICVAASSAGEQLQLAVWDNGQVRKPSKGLGVGHRNVASRLALIHPRDAGMEAAAGEDGFRVNLHLPLRLQAASVSPTNEAGSLPAPAGHRVAGS